MKKDTMKFHLAMAAVVGAAAVGGGQVRAAVVFSDTFGTGSTLNGSSSPNAAGTQTSYDIVSSKNATGSSIAAGDLHLTTTATSSGVAEAQAIFTGSPITLANPSDFIEATLVFTDTSGAGIGSGATVDLGLYNSGGSKPDTGLNNGGLNTANANHTTDGVSGWLGYAGQYSSGSGGTGQFARIYGRPSQTTQGNDGAQDLVSGPSTGGFATATTVGLNNSASIGALSAGSQYTEDLLITFQSPNVLTETISMYAGSGTGGTLVGQMTANTTVANFNTATFDGVAFGWRGATSVLDASSLTISSNVATATPEPASISLIGLAGAAMLLRRRRA